MNHNIEAALEQLTGWCEDDWIGLWLIVAYVAEDLGIKDPEKQLEATLILVRKLLKRGSRGFHPAGVAAQRRVPLLG